MKLSNRFCAALLLLASLAAFLITDRNFTLLDDETFIVDAARAPARTTIALFWSGTGQHEHPPLSDLLLHLWLPIGGFAPWALRLPSILFFLAGLLVLASAARSISGASASLWVLVLGVFSPFAFHFARLAGWYSFTFFLVAAATLAHLDYLKAPTRPKLAILIFANALLIYANYYGWLIVACLAFEVCVVRGRRQALRFGPAVFGPLVIIYLPLWRHVGERALAALGNAASPSPTRLILNLVYNFYSLFVSESVAPWFLNLSIPATASIMAALVGMWALLTTQGRRFFLYFALLFMGMACFDFINTKRLLFISPWLLLTFSIALANRTRPSAWRVTAASLALIGIIGWLGIVVKKYYASGHFIEPWAQLADEAAIAIKQGKTVVANSPSFLFYCKWSLQHVGIINSETVTPSSLVEVDKWEPAQMAGPVVFVAGVSALEVDTARTEQWLRSQCLGLSERRLVPDSGYALKAKFFPAGRQKSFRVSWQEFDCPGSSLGKGLSHVH